MCDCPDCLLVIQTRYQTAESHLEDTTLHSDRRMRGLIEETPHGTVALRRACAARLVGTLFLPGTNPDPGCQFLGRSERFSARADCGYDLLRRFRSYARNPTQALDNTLVRFHQLG